MRAHRCLLCVDGLMPAGIDPFFGPVLRACPHCHTRCLGCDGTGVFPASRGYALDAVFNVLYQLGWDVYLCDHCTGITTMWPPTLTAAAAPQVPDVTVYLPNDPAMSTQDNTRREDDADTIYRVETILRKLADDYYDGFKKYLTIPTNLIIDRALIRARLTVMAELGDLLADALRIAPPDWEFMREIAKEDPWAEHPEPGVNP